MPPTAARHKGYLGYTGPSCPKCSHEFRPGVLDSRTHTCPRGSIRFDAIRYSPAEVRIDVTQLAGGPDTDTPCSRHEGNSAVASCNRCGKFICGLCRTEADGQVFCPSCFDRLTSEGDLASTASRLRNWAGLASTMGFVSLLTLGMLIVPALLGIYFSIRGIRDKRARDEPDGIVGLYITLVILSMLAVLGIIGLVGIFGGFS